MLGSWRYGPLYRKLVGGSLNLAFGRFPKKVRIESTNHCNAKCITCPHPSQTRKLGIMDMDFYEQVLEQCVREGARELHLHNFGEPLIDKSLPERVRKAKEVGIKKVKIISNASLLDEKRARPLIEAGLDEVKVSFDGLSPEVYEKVRVGLKYEVSARNLERLVSLRDEMGSRTPRVEVLFVSIHENDKESPGFIERWKDVVDEVFVTRAHNWGGSDVVASSDDPREASGWPCQRLWNTFTILWDGRVALCCLDYDGQEILGDLRTQSIQEVWKGSRLTQIRQLHLAGKFGEIPICENCNAR